MEAIRAYMTEPEARAEDVYREVYYAEYMRVYEPKRSTDRERQVFWSDLAHRAARSARDKILAEQTIVGS